MILYLAADLIWATKIKCAAEALGIQARPVRTLDMLRARLHDSDPSALLVDLDAADTALELVRFMRGDKKNERHMRVRVVAWGPHIAKELFQRAREAGADDVLTRGALDHHLEEVLLNLTGRAHGHHAQSIGPARRASAPPPTPHDQHRPLL
jgi:CheY-like chemotaxis protein